ncbi:MAG: hypothetical protein ACR2JB_23225 [Bryobacteraceae bacterium]
MKLILTLVCLSGAALHLAGGESVSEAGAPGANPEAAKVEATPAGTNDGTSSKAITADDLNQLRERIAKQEEEIRRLQESIEEQRAFLEKAIQNSGGGPALTSASSAASNGPVKLVPVVNVAHPNIAGSGRTGQKMAENPSPLSINIGNTTFTPLGFVDFTWYGRSTNVGSGIGTSFGGVPYNTSAIGHLWENNFSTQNSRIGFRVDSKFMGAKVLGYFEADFLGNAAQNVFVTSNSNTFRMRNVFVDVQKNGLEVLGGQDWTLFTPNRKGLSPIPGDIFYSQNMDTNYQVGLIWARQSQFRLIAHPSENVAFGVSLENPQQYVGNGVVTFPASLSTAATGEFNNTTTTYSVPNLHPDIIFKAAYDGHAGDKILHLEAGALIRSFKFVNAVGKNPTKYESSTATAASGEVNANLEIVKNVRLIANTFFGSGGGRYAFGLGPDTVVRADGSISPVHSYSTVDGFEANITKNTLVSMLYGGAYFGRNTARDTDGSLIGYGFAGSATNNNRTVQEATFDLVQTFWKNPSYGALSLITQYSYVWRNPWSIPSSGTRYAKTNMIWLNLRYTLP